MNEQHIRYAIELGALSSFEVEQLNSGELVLKKYTTIYLDPDNKIECRLYTSTSKTSNNITLNFCLPAQEIDYYTQGLKTWLSKYEFIYSTVTQVYESNKLLSKEAMKSFMALDKGYRIVQIAYSKYALSVTFSRPPLDKQKALLNELGLRYDRGRKIWLIQTAITENYVSYIQRNLLKQEGLIVEVIGGL